MCLEERPRRGEEGGSPFISGCCRIAQDGGSMLTTTMSLNWANTTAQLVLRPASLRTHKAAAVSVVPLTCTHSPKKGADRQTRDRTPQPGFSDCAALEGLEPGEPNCNSPLPSRMVDEHHRQPVCTTVAVTKRWHGKAGVWRIARHNRSGWRRHNLFACTSSSKKASRPPTLARLARLARLHASTH